MARQPWRTKDTSALFRAILSIKTVADAERFFRDLCTLAEIREFAQRWRIARLLARGRSYREIADQLKVSTTTVARVAHWLDFGAGGYRRVLSKFGVKFQGPKTR